MQISAVSELFHVSPDTLRYYERIGLIPPVHRNRSGIRDYTPGDLAWVSFVLSMRDSGMSIEILTEYVSLCERGDGAGDERKQLLLEQRRLIRENIQIQQDALNRLNEKIAHFEEQVLPGERDLVDYAS
ncbi:MAG: MerR family transcriptional regulator [Spirochaetales bacterium]|nr:MerR family transcriptional regulator [Spirochaetales bacterium]